MTAAHRNVFILNGYVTPSDNLKTSKSIESHNVKPECNKPKSVSLKSNSFVDWSCLKPVHRPLKYIKVELLSNYNTSFLKDEYRVARTNEENPESQATEAPQSLIDEEEDEDVNDEPWGTSGALKVERAPPPWMWEGFSIEKYCPKPASSRPASPHATSQIPNKILTKDVITKRSIPKVTVPKPFKMTLREESDDFKQKKIRTAWEEPVSKPTTLPPFRANPVPKSTHLRLYDKMVDECGAQRKVQRDKRRQLLLAMQQPFHFASKFEPGATTSAVQVDGDAAGVEGATPEGQASTPSTEGILERTARFATRRLPLTVVDENLTFSPAINRTVPDFGRQHQRFEDHLRRARQEAQRTVPKPFSFQTTSEGGQSVRGPAKSCKKASSPVVKWDLAKLVTSSQRQTRSTLLRAEMVRKRITERQEKKLRLEQKAPSRLQGEVAKWLKAQKECSCAKAQRQQQIQRKEMRLRSAEYQAELADMMERVNNRPLLLQRHWQTQARVGAEQRFSTILKQAGVDEALLWSRALLQEQSRRLRLGAEETWNSGLHENLEGFSEVTEPATMPA